MKTALPFKGVVHDGEYQADAKLLDTMHTSRLNNIVVFVVRRYGGIHIGGLRLALIHKTAMDALHLLHTARGDVLTAGDEEEAEEDEDRFLSSAPRSSTGPP